MIRWAKAEDQAGILAVLQEAKAGWQGYDYTSLSGGCLVYEHEGEIVGVLVCTIARPDSYIRELAVLPQYQGIGAARDLVSALMAEATVFGSQAIEAFQYEEHSQLVKMISRRRIMVEKGIRLRVPLTIKALNTCPLALTDKQETPISWKRTFTPPGVANGQPGEAIPHDTPA